MTTKALAVMMNDVGLDASGNLVNNSIVVGPRSRVVTTTATALSLTFTQHAERYVLVNTNSTVANTFTLPTAIGSGNRITLINNVVQTQGSVVFTAATGDVIQGFCIGINSSASNCDQFVTTATSIKMNMTLTTQGGLGGDFMEAIDIAANTWFVRCMIVGSGTLATPFSA